MADQEGLIQWLLDQAEDPPDYATPEALADQALVDRAISEPRPVESGQHLQADPARPERESAPAIDPAEREKVSQAAVDAANRELNIGEEAQVMAPSRFMAAVAAVVERDVASGPPAEPERQSRQEGPAAEAAPQPKSSAAPAEVRGRSVEILIPEGFDMDAQEMFRIADKDVPLEFDGGLETKDFSFQGPPDKTLPRPTDEMVIDAYRDLTAFDSREVRRVR